MAEFDDLFGDLAVDLTTDFGSTTSGKLIVVTVGEIDATTGKRTESEDEKTVPMAPPFPFNQTGITNTLVETGDMSTIIAARLLSEEPVPNRDRVILAGREWQIVSVNPLNSGDENAAYTLQLRN